MNTDPLENTRLRSPTMGHDREMITVQTLKEMATDRYVLDLEWTELGECYGKAGALNFFPTSLKPKVVAPLKALCADCQVRLECLGFALLTRQEGGIWGGRTEQERTRIWNKVKRYLRR